MSPTPATSPRVSPTPLAEVALTAEGLKTETASRILVNSTTSPATQTVYGVRVALRVNLVIANLHCVVTTLAIGTVPTLIKMALIDKTGKVLGQSANLASDAMWTGTLGIKTIALAASVTVPADDGYYIAFLKNGVFGSTDLALLRQAVANTGQMAAVGSGMPANNTVAAQTDFPATNSSLAWSGTGSTSAWWFGAS